MWCCSFRRRHLCWVILILTTACSARAFSTLITATKEAKRATILHLGEQDKHEDNNDGLHDFHAPPSVSMMSRRMFGIASSASILSLFSSHQRRALAVATETVTPLASYPAITTESNSPLTLDCPPIFTSNGTTDALDFVQFDTANDVPAEYFTENRYIYGFVERVIDGDTIRVRHIPGYGIVRFQTPEPLQQRGIANVTLSVRIYGVDCPETGKNKRQVSQPYGDEATRFTTDMVYHKMVRITLLRRDQYHRAVAVVETVPDGMSLFGGFGGGGSRRRDLSEELAKAGLAELYTGGGAVYYDRRDVLEKAIVSAQRSRRGMWSLGTRRQSAADYKRDKATARATRPRGGGDGDDTNTPVMAVTGVHTNQKANRRSDDRQNAKGVVAVKSKTSSAKTNNNNNKENLLDAVVTGLEFVG